MILMAMRACRVVSSKPLVVGCFANIECKVVDTRLVNKYGLFVLEGLKAWVEPTQREFEDDPPSRLRQVRRRWQDDRIEVEDAVTSKEFLGMPKLLIGAEIVLILIGLAWLLGFAISAVRA